MQTTDEMTNLRMIFDRDLMSPPANSGGPADVQKENSQQPRPRSISSEEQALKELRAMPIYFASSFALVKPYVMGFDGNLLDAPSLKRTRLNTEWVAAKP